MLKSYNDDVPEQDMQAMSIKQFMLWLIHYTVCLKCKETEGCKKDLPIQPQQVKERKKEERERGGGRRGDGGNESNSTSI